MTKFAQKGYFRFQKEKWTSSSNSTYSNYSRFQVSSSTDNFVFLAEFAKKKVFLFQNRKSEDDHRIQNIRISLDVKFHRKLTILIVLTKFYPKIKKKFTVKTFCIPNLFSYHEIHLLKKYCLRRLPIPFTENTTKVRMTRKQLPEVFYNKRCSQKFRKIHRKIPVPVSLL